MRNMTMMCLGAMLALSFFLGGCAGNLPEPQRVYYLDDNWGRSVESARFNQTLDPEAGLEVKPVEGLDGRAADGGGQVPCHL